MCCPECIKFITEDFYKDYLWLQNRKALMLIKLNVELKFGLFDANWKVCEIKSNEVSSKIDIKYRYVIFEHT